MRGGAWFLRTFPTGDSGLTRASLHPWLPMACLTWGHSVPETSHTCQRRVSEPEVPSVKPWIHAVSTHNPRQSTLAAVGLAQRSNWSLLRGCAPCYHRNTLGLTDSISPLPPPPAQTPPFTASLSHSADTQCTPLLPGPKGATSPP